MSCAPDARGRTRTVRMVEVAGFAALLPYAQTHLA